MARILTPAQALADLATWLPTEDEWRSGADFMEAAVLILDQARIERPARYAD